MRGAGNFRNIISPLRGGMKPLKLLRGNHSKPEYELILIDRIRGYKIGVLSAEVK